MLDLVCFAMRKFGVAKSTPPSPAPLCQLCPGTLSNSSHTSHGSNFKKPRADTDITTAFLSVTYLGLHLFS